MVIVGSMRFELITSGKIPRLKLHAQPYSYDTLATEEELLALSAYLAREIGKRRDEAGERARR